MEKMVYMFSDERSGSLQENKLKYGGKGAGLAQMTSMGLPVPEGFTIPCKYSLSGENWPEGLKSQVDQSIKLLEIYILRQITKNRSEKPRRMPRSSLPRRLNSF